jgi:hypothetical protein
MLKLKTTAAENLDMDIEPLSENRRMLDWTKLVGGSVRIWEKHVLYERAEAAHLARLNTILQTNNQARS